VPTNCWKSSSSRASRCVSLRRRLRKTHRALVGAGWRVPLETLAGDHLGTSTCAFEATPRCAKSCYCIGRSASKYYGVRAIYRMNGHMGTTSVYRAVGSVIESVVVAASESTVPASLDEIEESRTITSRISA
jgi:hypothetical protein